MTLVHIGLDLNFKLRGKQKNSSNVQNKSVNNENEATNLSQSLYININSMHRCFYVKNDEILDKLYTLYFKHRKTNFSD